MRTAILLIVTTAMLAAAVWIRCQDISQPLVTFHATRHYRSAVLARHCYYRAASGIPEAAVEVAEANRAMQPAGEPPLMEWAACASYLVLGREEVAIPRVFAVLAWIAGAIPLYFLALRTASAATALVACALYLFLPYGIVASRNFQPDALMTLLSLTALIAMVRHHERPVPARRYTVAALVALAILIKPMSIFLTMPVLLGLHLSRTGVRDLRAHGPFVAMALLALLPPTLYYGYGAIFGSFARDQMHMRFVPQLLGTSFFWSGLLKQAGRVHTIPLLITGALGMALAPTSLGRVLLASLWAGYAAFAVAFTYHMPTHDYYHWPYIAVVALGTAAVLARLERSFADRLPRPALGALTTALCVAIAVLGAWSAWPRLHVPAAAATVARYAEIGVLAEHDTRVLFLDAEYGYPLMYHSEVSGDSWPSQDDLAAEALGGATALDARARFARDYADFAPRFFVVTDLASLEGQPDLQALLAERTTVVRRTPEYHVYRFID